VAQRTSRGISTRGIPWSAVWLLYRPAGHRQDGPGPGVCRDLKHALLRLQPGRDGNHDLIKAWGEMQVNVPCIALIEESTTSSTAGRTSRAKHGHDVDEFAPRKRTTTTNDRGFLTP